MKFDDFFEIGERNDSLSPFLFSFPCVWGLAFSETLTNAVTVFHKLHLVVLGYF